MKHNRKSVPSERKQAIHRNEEKYLPRLIRNEKLYTYTLVENKRKTTGRQT